VNKESFDLSASQTAVRILNSLSGVFVDKVLQAEDAHQVFVRARFEPTSLRRIQARFQAELGLNDAHVVRVPPTLQRNPRLI